MKIVFPIVSVALALLAVGCERPAAESSNMSPNGTVAILDLDSTATRLGRDVTITEQLKAQNDALIEKLGKTREQLQSQFETSRQAIGDKPTEADAQKLTEVGQRLTAELQAKQQEAREELNAKQATLIRQFREEVKPVAQKIALKKGFKTVLLRSDGVVLSSEPATDITDDVVGEMISSGKGSPTATPSASPTATP
jgi:Skp family chaperone for outer membrane proteins